MRNATSLCLVLSLLTIPRSPASAQEHLWSKSFGGPSNDYAQSVAVDNSGNVLIAGYFDDTINFGGGYFFSVGGTDIFIAKLDAGGNHLWSLRAGDTLDDRAMAIAADGDGNVFVAGSFGGTVNFGGANLVSAGGADIFLVKFDADGAHQWSKRFGSSSNESAQDIAIDGTGNVILAGEFRAPVNFGGGALVNQLQDAFLARFDTDGNHLWSKALGGWYMDGSRAVAVDAAGNITLLGLFTATASFGGANLVSAGENDCFLARYDANGAHLWSLRFGGDELDISTSVAVDASGNAFVTGYFVDTANYGGGDLVSAGSYDVFLAKYDAAGVHQWSQRFGSSYEDLTNDVAVDASGNVLITGRYDDDVDFGGGNLGTFGEEEIFLAQYDTHGNHQWSRRYGGLEWDEGQALAVDNTGSILLTGRFEQGIDLGGDVLVGFGFAEVFLLKLSAAGTGVSATPATPRISVSNHPNPFNPQTTVTYALASRGPVTVAVYDAHGARVAVLVDNEEHDAGTYDVRWDGRAADGSVAASGVYFVRVHQNGAVRSGKMVLLK